MKDMTPSNDYLFELIEPGGDLVSSLRAAFEAGQAEAYERAADLVRGKVPITLGLHARTKAQRAGAQFVFEAFSYCADEILKLKREVKP